MRIWDPATGEQLAVLDGHQYVVRAVCPVTVAGRDLLASASDDRTVRSWDPATGEQFAVLQDHSDPVTAVCPITVAGRDLLASASDDRTVRSWDPATARCLLTIPVHHEALAAAWVAGSLAIALSAGILVTELSPAL